MTHDFKAALEWWQDHILGETIDPNSKHSDAIIQALRHQIIKEIEIERNA